jgi:heterotetrameric sarcosine oxidase gamma subunit
VTRFEPVRTTALYRPQLALGARFRPEGAWKVAEVFTSVEDELRAARAGVGLADASAAGKLLLRGDAVEALVGKLAGPAGPAPGRAVRLPLDGARVLLARLAPDEALLLTAAADADSLEARLVGMAESAGCAHPTDVTALLAVLDLVGPRAPDLLARLLPLDLASLPPLGVVQGELSRVHAIVLRLDHPELPAFRLVVGRELGEFAWHLLAAAGGDLGLVPLGAAARARLVAEG